MSTYTDLHNRVKENITVDYNSRITPQEVHLLNQNNIYWGTFCGNLSGDYISKKQLSDVLTNITEESQLSDIRNVLINLKELLNN